MARVDYDRMAPDYRRGRGLALDGLDAWRAAVEPYMPPPGGLPVLDVGSGAGQWFGAFARWWGVRVLALEPSRGMRLQAAAGAKTLVDSVGGDARWLPLNDASCGAAWLSTVIHHIPDLVLLR